MRLAGAALVASSVLLVAACDGGGETQVKASGSSTSSSSSSSSTSSTTTTTTTSIPATTAPPVTGGSVPPTTVGVICTTPDEAAVALVEAWKSGDQPAAARCANPDVVATIFETSGAGATWTFEGCGGDDPGVPQCFYRYEGGGVTLTLNGTENTGWKVVTIGFTAD